MEDLLIIQKIEDMMRYGYQSVAHFPKSERHVMSQEIRLVANPHPTEGCYSWRQDYIRYDGDGGNTFTNPQNCSATGDLHYSQRVAVTRAGRSASFVAGGQTLCSAYASDGPYEYTRLKDGPTGQETKKCGGSGEELNPASGYANQEFQTGVAVEEGANALPAAVVADADGYDDGAHYVVLVDAWTRYDFEAKGATPPCNTLTEAQERQEAPREWRVCIDGADHILESLTGVIEEHQAMKPMFDFSDVSFFPRTVNIYDYHGTPVYVFSWIRWDMAEDTKSLYCAVSYRGELTVGAPIQSASWSFDIHGAYAETGAYCLGGIVALR